MAKKSANQQGSDQATRPTVAANKFCDFYPLAEAENLSYPNLVCALFDYHATGEGRTVGMLIIGAHSAEDLRAEVEEEWGEFYAGDVRVCIWNGWPTDFGLLHASRVDDLLKKFDSNLPMIRYATTLHFNFA